MDDIGRLLNKSASAPDKVKKYAYNKRLSSALTEGLNSYIESIHIILTEQHRFRTERTTENNVQRPADQRQ